MQKDELVYIGHMPDRARKATSKVVGKTRAEFDLDENLRMALAHLIQVLGEAAALLHPIGFDEPFGLSVVEAMACGTPVIAYRRGSMIEVVDDGITGFVVEDAAAALAVLDRATTLDRAAVRARAAARFGVDRMVEDYLGAYRLLLGLS